MFYLVTRAYRLSVLYFIKRFIIFNFYPVNIVSLRYPFYLINWDLTVCDAPTGYVNVTTKDPFKLWSNYCRMIGKIPIFERYGALSEQNCKNHCFVCGGGKTKINIF